MKIAVSAWSVTALMCLTACSDPAAEANKRLSDARTLFDSAQGKSADQRLSVYRKVDDILNSISKDFPQTNQAISIVGDQPIAGLSHSIIKDQIRISQNEVCYIRPNTVCLGRIFSENLIGYNGPNVTAYNDVSASIAGKPLSDTSYDRDSRNNPWSIAVAVAALGNHDLAFSTFESTATNQQYLSDYSPEDRSRITDARKFYLHVLKTCFNDTTEKCVNNFRELKGNADSNSRRPEELSKAVVYMFYATGNISCLASFLKEYTKIDNSSYFAAQTIQSPDGIYDIRNSKPYMYNADPQLKDVFVDIFDSNIDRLMSTKEFIQNDDLMGGLWAGVQKGQEIEAVASKITRGNIYYIGPRLCSETRRWIDEETAVRIYAWANKSLVGYKSGLDNIGW